MNDSNVDPAAIVSGVLRELGAQAAGLWRREGNVLLQVVFVPGTALDESVANEFARATERVSLDQLGLGIVVAATTGQVAVSREAELPPDSGSRIWLGRFGAARSVAVPLFGRDEVLVGVISVALPHDSRDDRIVAEQLRFAARDWVDSGSG